MAKKKKRNPQDVTLRNVKSSNKRLDKLEKEVSELRKLVRDLQSLFS